MSDPTSCDQCGQPHVRCSAHTKAGNPCGQPRMSGQMVCRKHGGKAPQNLAAAERRLAEREAMKALESFDLDLIREVNPLDALLGELYRTSAFVGWLDVLVAEIKKDDIFWGKTREKEGGDDAGVTHEAGTSAVVQLWERQRKHLKDVAKTCLDVGLDARRVALAERDGRLLASVVQAGFAQMQAQLLELLGSNVKAVAVVQESWQQLVAAIMPPLFRSIDAHGELVIEGEVVSDG